MTTVTCASIVEELMNIYKINSGTELIFTNFDAKFLVTLDQKTPGLFYNYEAAREKFNASKDPTVFVSVVLYDSKMEKRFISRFNIVDNVLARTFKKPDDESYGLTCMLRRTNSAGNMTYDSVANLITLLESAQKFIVEYWQSMNMLERKKSKQSTNLYIPVEPNALIPHSKIFTGKKDATTTLEFNNQSAIISIRVPETKKQTSKIQDPKKKPVDPTVYIKVLDRYYMTKYHPEIAKLNPSISVIPSSLISSGISDLADIEPYIIHNMPTIDRSNIKKKFASKLIKFNITPDNMEQEMPAGTIIMANLSLSAGVTFHPFGYGFKVYANMITYQTNPNGFGGSYDQLSAEQFASDNEDDDAESELFGEIDD